MAFDPFEDAPAIELRDWGESATVPTGVRHVIVVPRPRYTSATSIEIDGRPTPGGTVRLRATAGESFNVGPTPDGRDQTVVRGSKAAASAAELDQLCWRIHCGGRLLMDQLPRQDPGGNARSSSVTVQLPSVLTGETLVAVAYNWRPLVALHQHWWVEDRDGRARDGHAGTLQNDRQLAEIMGWLPRGSPQSQPVPAQMTRYFDAFLPLFPKYRVTGTMQQTHFLAQIKHECDRMRATRERIDPDVAAEKYAHKNGNRGLDDGRDFVGRGLIQITGYEGYQRFFSNQPQLGYPGPGPDEREWLRRHAPLVEQADLAALTAFDFWNWKNPRDPAAVDDVLGVSIRVNGWSRKTYLPNNYEERVRFTNDIKSVFGIDRSGGR